MSESKLEALNDGLAGMTELLIGAGSALGEVKVVRHDELTNDKHFLIVPAGYESKEISFDEFRQTPIRNKGVMVVSTVESLFAFVERELLPGTTVCLADQDNGSFKIIFNYSGGGDKPGFSDRLVALSLKPTTGWSRWSEKDKVRMDKLAFADFIDENIPDISEPAAAEVIEMIKQLKVHRKAEFISVVDPKTGFTNLSFNEQTSGETLKGNIGFFDKMVLGLTPFRGSEKYRVDASLRFEITDSNKLKVFYSLINADLVEEHAFNVEREKVLEKMRELGIPVFDI
ncbi:MAG: DUF2303 family protein [Limnohabitans sp.]